MIWTAQRFWVAVVAVGACVAFIGCGQSADERVQRPGDQANVSRPTSTPTPAPEPTEAATLVPETGSPARVARARLINSGWFEAGGVISVRQGSERNNGEAGRILVEIGAPKDDKTLRSICYAIADATHDPPPEILLNGKGYNTCHP